jgi:pantoate--beta-alanine ligase
MRVIQSLTEMQDAAANWRRDGKLTGLVPTMGYFHEGHLSLMRRARAECERVSVSLFVNPVQFGPKEDLATYPRDFDRDCRFAREEGADALFAPSAGDMYPGGYSTYVEVDGMSRILCGASRPGHFRGVATVVLKLFHIAMPDRAYFGMKDYQQTVVIQRMVADLNLNVRVVRCETVREPDGLAMSSRNVRLSPDERRAAPVLYRALCYGRTLIGDGLTEVSELRDCMLRVLATEPSIELDYLELSDASTLEPASTIAGPTVIAVAARLGRTRLIDNILVP